MKKWALQLGSQILKILWGLWKGIPTELLMDLGFLLFIVLLILISLFLLPRL